MLETQGQRELNELHQMREEATATKAERAHERASQACEASVALSCDQMDRGLWTPAVQGHAQADAEKEELEVNPKGLRAVWTEASSSKSICGYPRAG